MKNKVLTMLMAAVLLGSTLIGCEQKQEEPVVKQEEIKKDKVQENALNELKKYVKDIDKLAILKGTKNVDLSEAVGKLISSEKNKEVKKVSVDDSKIDYEKTGKYPADIKIELEEKALKDTVDITVVTEDELEKNNELVLIGKDNHELSKIDAEKKEDEKTEDKKQRETKEKTKVEEKPDSKPATNAADKPSSNPQTKPSTKPQNNSTPKPQHKHNWVAQTHNINHPEVGHNEQYVIKAEWDETVTEEVPVYWSCCNVCGADCTGNEYEHEKQHALNYEGGGHHLEVSWETKMSTIHHDAEYGTRYVVDTPAWTETIVDGYKCSSCGATK